MPQEGMSMVIFKAFGRVLVGVNLLEWALAVAAEADAVMNEDDADEEEEEEEEDDEVATGWSGGSCRGRDVGTGCVEPWGRSTVGTAIGDVNTGAPGAVYASDRVCRKRRDQNTGGRRTKQEHVCLGCCPETDHARVARTAGCIGRLCSRRHRYAGRGGQATLHERGDQGRGWWRMWYWSKVESRQRVPHDGRSHHTGLFYPHNTGASQKHAPHAPSKIKLLFFAPRLSTHR